LPHAPGAPRHIGDEQLDGIGADINDGAAHGGHGARIKYSGRWTNGIAVFRPIARGAEMGEVEL
jgi:hypothetical protein